MKTIREYINLIESAQTVGNPLFYVRNKQFERLEPFRAAHGVVVTEVTPESVSGVRAIPDYNPATGAWHTDRIAGVKPFRVKRVGDKFKLPGGCKSGTVFDLNDAEPINANQGIEQAALEKFTQTNQDFAAKNQGVAEQAVEQLASKK